MSSRLINSLAITEPLVKVFSDESVLQAMLDFEAALARAEAQTGIIPASAADAITTAAKPGNFDVTALATAGLRAGTLTIPLVKALTEHVGKVNAEAARFVHWGATSQDVVDTAMSLLLIRAEKVIAEDCLKLDHALASLVEDHKKTVMLGRTLLQPAPPVTFGLKAAGWLSAVRRGWQRLQGEFHTATILQFGGASGTLASLGDRGISVSKALNKELGFRNLPPPPWHTHRDRLASLICACGILTGSLGKMARDISLLMQNEVGEASEPGGEGRGSSSTMPQKHNPTACALTLAASHRLPGLVASFLSAMVQEHERAIGGWHAEWPIIADAVQLTGLAVASMSEAAAGLSIDASRMRANIDHTKGSIFAERAMLLLGEKLGREEAHNILAAAAKKTVSENKRLTQVLAEIPQVTTHLTPAALDQLETPEQYLGSVDAFRQTLAAEPERKKTNSDDE